MLPNYLLDDYVPSPETKAASNQSASSSASRAVQVEASQQQSDSATGPPLGATNAGYLSDASSGPLGLLPRRKKKLRQACVYCRRSHLVCEEKRPCHRCVKRGIADRCVDPPSEALSQDGGWTGSIETGSSTGSGIEAQASPTPPAVQKARASPATPTSAEGQPCLDGGQKRKRKAKSETPRMSAPSQRPVEDVDSRSNYSQPSGAIGFANEPVSGLAPASDHVESVPSSTTTVQGSTLSSAMPAPGSSSFTTVPLSMAAQGQPSGSATSVPSQLLQGQPIFQPPSSAELDSLFSTYFFDVADAFNTRQNIGQHQAVPSPLPIGQAGPPFHPQQIYHPPGTQRHSGHHPGNVINAAHNHRFDVRVAGADQHDLRSASTGLAEQHQQHQPPDRSTVDQFPGAGNVLNSTYHNGANSSLPAPVVLGANMGGRIGEHSADGRDLATRQRPGDVYAPYPYRKGYASLMRYMTEQNWSQHSIKSVEAALSKVRQLWFSLEDNIQPSSMIQLQAEWAGNVRYFSESVLPFTPVPMVVCRKAGEVYASNQLAQDLCGRSKEQMTGGKLSCYELVTESSASKFFRLYELAVGGSQAEDGSYIPAVRTTAPLYWNAEIVRRNADGSQSIVPTRGIFEMKIAPCGLPSLLVCCFVPLT